MANQSQFSDNFMKGIQLADQHHQTQLENDRAKTEHDLKVKEAKIQLDVLKLQQAKMEHEAGMSAVATAETQPGEEFKIPGLSATPGGVTQDSVAPAQMQGPPASILDLLRQNRQPAPLYPGDIPGVAEETKVVPHVGILVPSALPDQPAQMVQPRTMQDILAAKNRELAIQRSMQPPVFAPAGSQPFVPQPGGGYAAQGAPIPKEEKPPNPPNLQRVMGKFNGIPATAGWNPDDNTYRIGGIDVSSQFQPDVPEKPNPNAARNDRSFNSRSAELEKAAQPIADSLQRVGRLKDTLNTASPIADSVTAPELMVVMAGGAGSGVRITQAEINSILGGAGKVQQALAALQQWSLDPAKANKILEPMRGQIKQLLATVDSKLQAKNAAIEDARQKLIDSEDPKIHKQVLADTRKALTDIDSAKVVKSTSKAPTGVDQAVWDVMTPQERALWKK